MVTASKEECGGLIDDLYLEMLGLMEQQISCRVNIGRLSNGGQLLLAKTRYVQGSNTVGAAQLPTENSENFKSLYHLTEEINNDRISGTQYELVRHSINKDEGYVEPLKWFGVLTPSSLRAASDQFKKCIQLIVDSANLQRELSSIFENIEKLKRVMTNFKSK